jgi:hypothetical protein
MTLTSQKMVIMHLVGNLNAIQRTLDAQREFVSSLSIHNLEQSISRTDRDGRSTGLVSDFCGATIDALKSYD